MPETLSEVRSAAAMEKGEIPAAVASERKRLTESGLTPKRDSVDGSAFPNEGTTSSRRLSCNAPKMKRWSLTIGPPNPPENWFCVYPCATGEGSLASTARSRSRRLYEKLPCGVLVPPRVVDDTTPP